ncbi:cytochrome C biogenesis protein CcmE [Achromatium sp. WMS2]|nr:cytochrome C biogenesis protein CcmE [Achromatium sp. WMS2]
MKARHKRMILALVGLTAVAGAAMLAISALRKNVAYFFTPSQVVANKAPNDRIFRLGGLVENGSLQRQPNVLQIKFMITDLESKVPVVYSGILPDLFKEGQGVVAKGRLGTDGIFQANEVLAKHDESYMPPEVADTLKKDHVEGVLRAVKGTAK